MNWAEVEELVQQIAAETIPDDGHAEVSVHIVRYPSGTWDCTVYHACQDTYAETPADDFGKTRVMHLMSGGAAIVVGQYPDLETTLTTLLDFVSTETPVPA